MALDLYTDTARWGRPPRSPRLLGEPSTAIAFSNEDALAWVKTFREETLNFATDKYYENHAVGVDPFTKAEDGKYLLYLADDGTLKEMIPAERRRESLNDPEFCRRMATLSQEGRLFMRHPGQAYCRQVLTGFEKDKKDKEKESCYIGFSSKFDKLNLQPREIPAPVAPKAPSRWKYLLYFLKSVRDEFKKYNEEKKQFDNNYNQMLVDRANYAENLEKSLRQLDNNELDEETLKKELDQQNIAKENWEYDKQMEANHDKLRANKFSEEQIQKYDAEIRRLNDERKHFEKIRPLKFESEDKMIEVACYAQPDADFEYSYMEVLKDRGKDELDVSRITPHRRSEIVKNCIIKNLKEINRYSTKDPEYRMLLEMNEALFAYDAKHPSGSFSQTDREALEQEHKRHKGIFTTHKETAEYKIRALEKMLDPRPSFAGNGQFELAYGLLSEIFKLTDAVQKISGDTEINPLVQEIGDNEGALRALADAMKTTSVIQSLRRLPVTQILDVLTDREKMFELAEKMVNESDFRMMQKDLRLDEQLEEAKAYGLYGDKSTLNTPRVKAFQEHLENTAKIQTAVHTTNELKNKYVTFESYCEAMALSLEKQMAQSMLKKLETVPEQNRNVFLVQHRRTYQRMAKELREYVSNNVDKDRIKAVIREGYERGYKNNPERKTAIQQERLRLMNNGWQEFCQSKPELAAKLNQMQVAQQSQQQVKQPEMQPKAAVPGMGGKG